MARVALGAVAFHSCTMSRTFVVFSLAISFLAGGCGSRAASSHDGVFSDVRINPETGDASGIRIVVSDRGRSSTVHVTVCEGGCNGGSDRPAIVRGERITFTLREPYFDQRGSVAEVDETRCDGSFGPDALVLTCSGSRSFHATIPRAGNSTAQGAAS